MKKLTMTFGVIFWGTLSLFAADPIHLSSLQSPKLGISGNSGTSLFAEEYSCLRQGTVFCEFALMYEEKSDGFYFRFSNGLDSKIDFCYEIHTTRDNNKKNIEKGCSIVRAKEKTAKGIFGSGKDMFDRASLTKFEVSR